MLKKNNLEEYKTFVEKELFIRYKVRARVIFLYDKREKTKDETMEFAGKIIETVCDTAGVEDIFLLDRSRRKVDARVVCSQLLHERLSLSYVAIGKLMRRDHTTIMNHLKLFKKQVELRETFAVKTNTILTLYHCASEIIDGRFYS